MLVGLRFVTADFFWSQILEFYNNIRIHEYVVMPNHVHGIIEIVASGVAQCATRTEGAQADSRYGLLSKVVKAYKEAVGKEIRNKLGEKDFRWHRSFHDEIIRDERALNNIRKYIIENPDKWWRDGNNFEK